MLAFLPYMPGPLVLESPCTKVSTAAKWFGKAKQQKYYTISVYCFLGGPSERFAGYHWGTT